MPSKTHSPAPSRKPISPHGASFEAWLIREGHPPSTAGILAEIAGFPRRDDWHAPSAAVWTEEGVSAPSINSISQTEGRCNA